MTSPSLARARGAAVTILGLAALVGANYFLRHTLEQSDSHLFLFLSYYYPDAVRKIFSPDFPLWKYFLPICELTGAWTR